MIPIAEVYMAASWKGDSGSELILACREFMRCAGRPPNFVAVELAQVEELEAIYSVRGIDVCNPYRSGVTVPLIFADGIDQPLPPITTLRLPPASDRIPFTFVRLPSDPL